jgi:tetratricopeptide (TPR) repeat protein
MTPMNDRMARSQGLEMLAGASRGSLFNITGTGAAAFDRIAGELAGYYLLGVESGATDKDGKTHPIRVEVTRPGVTIRARRALLATRDDLNPRNPREAVMAALATPLPVSALPMRVATFSLLGPEAQKVQLLIHADVGTDYSSSRVVTFGYIISDEAGRIVDSQAGDARLPPIMNGVPSALQFSAGASLAAGDYSIKLAVVEGDRVGTVEHTIHAGLVDASPLKVSDLMVGGPTNAMEELLQPTVGHTVVFGTVHGYLEAYGTGVRGLKGRYEIIPDEQGEPILTQEVPARMAGDSRAIFTRMLPVRQLPPGQYLLRATLSSGETAVKTLTRSFEVAAPAVLMTSAAGPGLAATPGEVYLSVTEEMLSRPVIAGDFSRPDTLRTFRDRVSGGARDAFDKGVGYLSAGQYAKAEETLKSAIDLDAESTAVLAYLAACFAAAGHDTEAASAWQTSLIEGSDLPQIYEWLGDALIRKRDLAQARAVLEEATAKWPADVRFARPMALIYATFGQGREAVRSLERYLGNHPSDTDALFLGVEWIYQLRLAGTFAHSSAEDLKLARKYADGYAKTKGPRTALVKQWMEFLDGRKR